MAAHMQRNLPGAAGGLPVVLCPVRVTPCYCTFFFSCVLLVCPVSQKYSALDFWS